MPKGGASSLTPVHAGLQEDLDAFLKAFLKLKSIRFSDYKSLFKSRGMIQLYNGRQNSAEIIEFNETLLVHCLQYLEEFVCPGTPRTLEERLFGLYSLYTFFYIQETNHVVKIRMDPDAARTFRRFSNLLRHEEILDAYMCCLKLEEDKAIKFVAFISIFDPSCFKRFDTDNKVTGVSILANINDPLSGVRSLLETPVFSALSVVHKQYSRLKEAAGLKIDGPRLLDAKKTAEGIVTASAQRAEKRCAVEEVVNSESTGEQLASHKARRSEIKERAYGADLNLARFRRHRTTTPLAMEKDTFEYSREATETTEAPRKTRKKRGRKPRNWVPEPPKRGRPRRKCAVYEEPEQEVLAPVEELVNTEPEPAEEGYKLQAHPDLEKKKKKARREVDVEPEELVKKSEKPATSEIEVSEKVVVMKTVQTTSKLKQIQEDATSEKAEDPKIPDLEIVDSGEEKRRRGRPRRKCAVYEEPEQEVLDPVEEIANTKPEPAEEVYKLQAHPDLEKKKKKARREVDVEPEELVKKSEKAVTSEIEVSEAVVVVKTVQKTTSEKAEGPKIPELERGDSGEEKRRRGRPRRNCGLYASPAECQKDGNNSLMEAPKRFNKALEIDAQEQSGPEKQKFLEPEGAQEVVLEVEDTEDHVHLMQKLSEIIEDAQDPIESEETNALFQTMLLKTYKDDEIQDLFEKTSDGKDDEILREGVPTPLEENDVPSLIEKHPAVFQNLLSEPQKHDDIQQDPKEREERQNSIQTTSVSGDFQPPLLLHNPSYSLPNPEDVVIFQSQDSSIANPLPEDVEEQTISLESLSSEDDSSDDGMLEIDEGTPSPTPKPIMKTVNSAAKKPQKRRVSFREKMNGDVETTIHEISPRKRHKRDEKDDSDMSRFDEASHRQGDVIEVQNPKNALKGENEDDRKKGEQFGPGLEMDEVSRMTIDFCPLEDEEEESVAASEAPFEFGDSDNEVSLDV